MGEMMLDVNDFRLRICRKVPDVERRSLVCATEPLLHVGNRLCSRPGLLFPRALQVEEEVQLGSDSGGRNRDDVDVVHRQVLRLKTVLDGVDRKLRVMLDAHEPLFGDVGDYPSVTDEGSAAVVSDMDTKNVHSLSSVCVAAGRSVRAPNIPALIPVAGLPFIFHPR